MEKLNLETVEDITLIYINIKKIKYQDRQVSHFYLN